MNEDIEAAPVSNLTVEMDTEHVGDYDGNDEIELVDNSDADVSMDAVPEGDYAGADKIELDEEKKASPEEKVVVGETVDFEF